MKRLAAILSVLALLCWSCSNEEDVLPEQQRKIVSFLTGTHQPRLTLESDEVKADKLPYYSIAGNTAYRYIDDVYNSSRTNAVTASSKVTITFRAYVFSYTAIVVTGTQITAPYYTNDSALAELFFSSSVGLSPGEWSFEPLVIDMASSDILKGLRASLLGCCEGDSVEVYMTYNMAYGDKNFGIIPRESPIAIFFTVDKVE